MQKIDKLDCELYKYYNYIFEFIFSVLHEIFIQDWRKVYYWTSIFTDFHVFKVEMVSKEHVS